MKEKLKRILSLCLALALMAPLLAAPAEASSSTYYPKFTGSSGSIVDILKSIGASSDSSFSRRAKIAAANGICSESAYRGSSEENIQMVALARAGKLKRPGGSSSAPAPAATPAPSSTSSLIFPVNNGMKIAYYYGYTTEYGGTHSGLDIHANGDTAIYAAASGTVVAVANSCPHISYGRACAHWTTYGNYLKIKGSDGRFYIYGHLKQNSLRVSVGQRVSAGQQIATMGSSGWSTGTHLHFEIRSSTGSKVNVNPANFGKYRGPITYVNGPYGT